MTYGLQTFRADGSLDFNSDGHTWKFIMSSTFTIPAPVNATLLVPTPSGYTHADFLFIKFQRKGTVPITTNTNNTIQVVQNIGKLGDNAVFYFYKRANV